MDLTCLNIYPPIPPVPRTANDSNIFVNQTYDPSSGGLAQIISTWILRSTFSANDIHSLINTISNADVESWTVSGITKIKPIPSLIIYFSVALALFLIFSIIFCVSSCSCGNSKRRYGPSKSTKVCAVFLIIVYLLGIGDLAYVAYRISKSKSSIDDTITVINREIFPKEVSEHMEYLTKQVNRLDQYCIESNSILINASKSMLVKTFNKVLNEKYYVDNISHAVNTMDEHIRQLSDEVDKESTLPPSVIKLFEDFAERYKVLLNDVQIPIKEVCNYANSSQTDIDKKLLEALNIVHVELKKFNDTVYNDILSEITPWEEHVLLDKDVEDVIRRYSGLAGTLFMVLVLLLGGIPLIFFFLILICRVCRCCKNDSNDDTRIPLTNMGTRSTDDGYENNNHHEHKSRNQVHPINYHGQPGHSEKRDSAPSGVVLCLMRIAFFLMMILFMVMVGVTSVYYVFDLTLQSSCRTFHDDQPYLINLISDQLIKSNVIIGNSSDMNTTIINLINDCESQVHFSRKLLQNYWSTLDNKVKDMMNTLSRQIFDQFINSTANINIPSDIDLLVNFTIQANVPNISRIAEAIETDLTTLEGYFDKITSSNSTLPQDLVQTTIDEFKAYVKNVLESTVDACPLPLSTISKTDTLICQTLSSSISGLWLSVLFCMALITLGFCIFGVCIYKRL